MDGERFDIKARVHALSGYSAHADQKGLIEWVEAMGEKPGEIKLVHGEPKAQRELGVRLSLLSLLGKTGDGKNILTQRR